MQDYTPHQQKIIKRYYQNQDSINLQKLGEQVTELYLAEGKKRERAWKSVSVSLEKLGVSAARVQHLVTTGDPALVAKLLTELQRQG